MSAKTVKNMIDWIEGNLMDHPTLDGMSAFVGYSAYYCSSKFHEFVGISFKEYVRKRRLELAAKELYKTDVRILDIAIKYGFSSNEAFTRAFFRDYGATPTQFRRDLLNDLTSGAENRKV